MLGVIAKVIQAGVKYAVKRGAKKAAKNRIKNLAKNPKKTPGKTKAEMPPKSKPNSLRGSKEKLNKQKNELKNLDKDDSPTYNKMLKRGVKKKSERLEKAIESKKPGMSEGYKFRQRKMRELNGAKRQMAKQGHTKRLADRIGKLQEQIDKSYGK